MRILLAIAVLVLSAVIAPSAQPLQALKSTAPLNLRLNGVTVGEALGAIERASEITIRIADNVSATALSRPALSIIFRDAGVITAIDFIANQADLTVIVADESTVIVQPKAR